MKRMPMWAGLIFALAMATTPALAQSPGGLEGAWEGFLHPTPAVEIRIILWVEKGPAGALKAKAESPEIKAQGTLEFPEVSLKDGAVTFLEKGTGREFSGKLNPGGTEIAGVWKKGTNSTPLTVARVVGPVLVSDVWEGMITANGGIKLRLAFHALKVPGGTYRGTMDSPDQGAFGLKLTTVEVAGDALKFAITGIGEFEGKVDAGGTSASGQWKQGGANFPITLKKVAEVSLARRPQTPKAPFPYRAEEVNYDSLSPGVKIAGTLTVPPGPGPFPVALLITGSGPQDRDETLLGHKPFLVLADDLSRRGIAVLRVDDRGVGGSTGIHANATTEDFAQDVRGGIEFLKLRTGIDPRRIGLIGHSEGGLIAPMVAARSKDVAFIVLLAGPGLPGDQILARQVALILKAAGANEAEIRAAVDTQVRLMAIVKEAKTPQDAAAKLKTAGDDVVKALPEAERKALNEVDPSGSRIAMLASPWYRFFLSHDPRPDLARVGCPVLAINGENDLQVPCRENLEAIDRAVRSGGNSRVSTQEMVGLNHLFQTSATGAPSEYNTIEETFAPEALKRVGDWVVETTRSR